MSGLLSLFFVAFRFYTQRLQDIDRLDDVLILFARLMHAGRFVLGKYSSSTLIFTRLTLAQLWSKEPLIWCPEQNPSMLSNTYT